jgi:glycosyltransferase involved in cell wall biosynthesis
MKPRLQGKSILVVGHAVQYGGAEVYLLEILTEIISSGAHVTVLWCNEDIPHKLKQQFNALDMVVLYEQFGVWKPDSLVYNRKFAKFLASIRCDLILFNRTGGWAKYSDLIPTARWKKRVPMVCVEHFHPPKFPIRLFQPFRTLRNLVYCRFQARLFDRVICMNNEAKARFASIAYGYSAKSLSRIYNGIDTDQFSYSEQAADLGRHKLGLNDEFIVMYSGRLSIEKGPDLLLQAWSLIPESQRKGKQLILVGEGGMRPELEGLLCSLNIAESVSFVGFQEDILPYLCAASLVVMPSREESFGISLAEAMSVGRYAVATTVGGLPELVSGVPGVEMVEPESYKELAAAIEKQLETISQMGSMNLAASRHIQQHFSASSMRRETVNCLLDLI